MVLIGPLNKTSPFVQFWCEGWVVSQDAANNRSRIGVRIQAVNTGNSGSFFGGSGQHIGAVNGVGNVVIHSATPFLPSGVPSGADRWNGHNEIWITHNAAGFLGPLQIDMGVFYGSVGEVHSAGLGVTRIPKPPTVPRSPTVSNILPTQATLGWTAPADNMGSAVNGYQVQVSLNSNMEGAFLTPQIGNVLSYTPTNLIPATRHYWQVRARNSSSGVWGAWTATQQFDTLAGGRIKHDGVWVNATPWVKVDGVWYRARPWEKDADVWKAVR